MSSEDLPSSLQHFYRSILMMMGDDKEESSIEHSSKDSQADNETQQHIVKPHPPSKHSRQLGSADIKLADLMDEDEARWMSTMESSRSPTPSQSSAPPSMLNKTNNQATTSIHDLHSNSRNITPPLPPLREERDSTLISQRQIHESVDLTEGLTALPRRAEEPKRYSFAQQVFLAAKDDLLYNYAERHRMPWHFKTLNHGAIDLTTLQKMQKHVLQQKLVAQVRALGEKESWMEVDIGETLNNYCKTLQNLEYMEHHAHQGARNDPFLITTRRPLEAQLLEEAGLAQQHPGARSAPKPFAAPIHHISRGSPCLQLLARVVVMLLVAAAILLPFLVAVFLPGYLPRVVVACACITIFAVVAAALSGSYRSRTPIIALLLLYAAGLIIFVGVMPLDFSG